MFTFQRLKEEELTLFLHEQATDKHIKVSKQAPWFMYMDNFF